jgi:hypothetical protein
VCKCVLSFSLATFSLRICFVVNSWNDCEGSTCSCPKSFCFTSFGSLLKYPLFIAVSAEIRFRGSTVSSRCTRSTASAAIRGRNSDGSRFGSSSFGCIARQFLSVECPGQFRSVGVPTFLKIMFS